MLPTAVLLAILIPLAPINAQEAPADDGLREKIQILDLRMVELLATLDADILDAKAKLAETPSMELLDQIRAYEARRADLVAKRAELRLLLSND